MTDYTIGTAFVVDQPTQNNRVYSRADLEKAIESYKTNPTRPLTFGSDMRQEIDFDKVVGNVESIWIDEGGRMMVNVKLHDTPHNPLMEAIQGGQKLTAYPVGIGRVDDKGVISDYELVRIDVGPEGL